MYIETMYRMARTTCGRAALLLVGLVLTPATVAALRVGLSASVSDATGGPEAFNLAMITAVPEPGTLLFAVTAVAGLSFVAWRRRNQRF
jgi:hypothetical protein